MVIPSTIQVFPNPGFKFIKWDVDIIPEADLNNSAIRFNPAENNRFTAFFGTSDDKNQLMVYPNPAKQRVQIGCLLTQDGRGRIEVVNATGQKVLHRETETLFMGVNKWELEMTSLASGVYMLNLITNEGIKSARLVIL